MEIWRSDNRRCSVQAQHQREQQHVVSVLVDEKRGKAKFDKDDHRIRFKRLRIDQKDRFDDLAAESLQPASSPTQRAPVFSTDPADALFGVLGFDSTQQQEPSTKCEWP